MTAQAPRERELKLDLDTKDAARARSTVSNRLGAPARVARLESTYWDTAAHDLAAAGVTLRVRLSGGSRIQTVKRSRGAAAALFERDEWEVPLASRQPDLAAFADTPAGEAFALETLRLTPVFRTVVERTIWPVSRNGVDIEVALDQGRAAAGRRSERFAELELELKAGQPQHLFALARELGAGLRLWPGIETKSERGYRLARVQARRVSKAAPLALSKRMTVADAFAVIVNGCVRHLGLNVPLVVEQRAPDALHQARVALRRLRSALSIFQPVASDAQSGPLKSDLQQLSQALGEARNLDVYIAGSTGRSQAHSSVDAEDDRVRADLERRRTSAYDDVVARLSAPRFGTLLIDLVAWAEAGPWRLDRDPARRMAREQPIRDFAAEVLRTRRRRLNRRGRHLAALDPAARHRVRIEAKKLRYASEFFAGLARGKPSHKRLGRFAAALEDLQGSLGELNDIETGHHLATSLGMPSGAPPAHPFASEGDTAARTEALLRRAEAAHRRLGRAKRFWSPWRR